MSSLNCGKPHDCSNFKFSRSGYDCVEESISNCCIQGANRATDRIDLLNCLSILNIECHSLATEDPNPTGRHLGEEQVIELKEISLESAIRQSLLVVAYQEQGKFKIGAVMGYIRENFPQFTLKD